MPNESLIHADIFFFISTIALVLITIGIIVAFVYIIRILKNVNEISDKIKAEGNEIVEDIKRLRAVLREEGVKWRAITDIIRGFFWWKGNPSDKTKREKRAK